MDSIVYKNVLPWRGCEKLYLDTQSSDVFFIFQSERSYEVEKIPAHKCILSATSPVFRAMFYGPQKQHGDIEIVGATADVFVEFLQFFYHSHVKLAAETLPDVMTLCRRYQLDDWQTVLHACGDISKSSLTLDKLCWGYELAILSESEELKSFCEEEIGKNAVEVFRSNNFLKCQHNLLRHILQLDTLDCTESMVFDGCMAWAIAQCSRKGCDANSAQNLRAQLGNLFYDIRFSKMTYKEFQYIYRTYDGLFSAEEFRDITMKIMDREDQAEKFNRRPYSIQNTPVEPIRIEPEIELTCNRSTVYSKTICIETDCFETTFISTSQLLLKGLLFSRRFKIDLGIDFSIYEDSTAKNDVILVAFESERAYYNDMVTLSSPIMVKANIRYRIDISVPFDRYEFSYRAAKTVRSDDGTLIGFGDDNPYVETLHFLKCENH